MNIAIPLSDRAAFLIAANLVKYSVGLVMPMVLVRLLSQSDYGTYQQMLLIGTALMGVMTLGLPTSVFYLFHHVGAPKVPALVLQTTVILAICGAAAAAVAFAGAGYFAGRFSNPALESLLGLYALSLLFMIGSEHCLSFLITQNRYGLALVTEVLEIIFRVVVMLCPLYFGYGMAGLVVGIVIYSAVRFLARNFLLIARSGYDYVDWRQNTSLRDQLGYSAPLALIGMTSLIGSTINRGILAAFFTPAQYAIYAVGTFEIPLDSIFQASVANVMRATLPALIREGNLAEVRRILLESARKLSIIMLPSFVFLEAYSYELITLLFTSKYAESVNIFRCNLLMIPLNILVLSPIPQAFGKPKINLYITVAWTALLISSSIVLMNWIGFFGPVIAYVVTQYLVVFVYIFFALRLTKASIAQIIPTAQIMRVVFASMIALAAAKSFDPPTASGLLNLVCAGLVFSGVFFLVAIPIRVFAEQDLAMARRWGARVFRVRAEGKQ